MRTGRVAARASRALQKAAPRARAPAPRLAPQCRAIAQELGLSSQDELLDDTLCAPAFVSCENEPGEGTKLSVRVCFLAHSRARAARAQTIALELALRSDAIPEF